MGYGDVFASFVIISSYSFPTVEEVQLTCTCQALSVLQDCSSENQALPVCWYIRNGYKLFLQLMYGCLQSIPGLLAFRT